MSLGTRAEHMLNILRRQRLDPRQVVRYFDDFTSMAIDDTTSDPTEWEIVQDAGASGQIGPAAGKFGGWFNISCDGDDNDECYAANRCESFIFDTTRHCMFECRVEHTAGTTDGLGTFVVGLSDTVAANTILDAGTLMASFDGALFIKEESANIAFVTSNAATQTRTASAQAWVDGGVHRLGFYYDPSDGVTGQITPVVDGVGGTGHAITITGLQEMHILLGVKTMENAVEQTLEVDWVEVIQRR